MNLQSIAAAVLAICALACSGRAQDASSPWSRITEGMSLEETDAILGKPLIRSIARGYEIWTYDNCGQVIFWRKAVLQFTVEVPPPRKTGEMGKVQGPTAPPPVKEHPLAGRQEPPGK